MPPSNLRLIAAILAAQIFCAGFTYAQVRADRQPEAPDRILFEDTIDGDETFDLDAYLVAQQDNNSQDDRSGTQSETRRADDRTRQLAPEPTPQRARSQNPFLNSARSLARQSYQRLARAPDIFGDEWYAIDVDTADFIDQEIPFGARAQLLKVAEHNSAVPKDRAFFLYNHFHNALDEVRRPVAGGPSISRTFDVNRYTFGLEKTFGCGCCQSIEVRLPLKDRFDSFRPDLLLASGSWGDVSVILKRVMYRDSDCVVSAGFGFNVPTGSDARGTLPGRTMRFEIDNQAIHFLPYVGFTASGEELFQHGFAQLDVPLNGNPVEVVDTSIPARFTGDLVDQVLLHLDYSIGYWHFRNACSCCCDRGITGLASVVELHYTVPFGGGDAVRSFPAAGGPVFRSDLNDLGVLNLTFGLHAELNRCSALRVGMVFPFRSGDNRYFDAELMASLVRRF